MHDQARYLTMLSGEICFFPAPAWKRLLLLLQDEMFPLPVRDALRASSPQKKVVSPLPPSNGECSLHVLEYLAGLPATKGIHPSCSRLPGLSFLLPLP